MTSKPIKNKPPVLKINDEYDTPSYAFDMLKCFEDQFENKIIWDPFVSETSLAGPRIRTCFPNSKEIIHNKSYDLMTNSFPPTFDIIITNPPYSCKKDVVEKCLALGKPFCLLLPLETVSRRYMTKHYQEIKKDLCILFPEQRVNFIPLQTKRKRASNSPFHSVWVCFQLKPSPLVSQLQFMLVSQDSKPLPRDEQLHQQL